MTAGPADAPAESARSRLDAVVKTYDIRGRAPEQLDATLAAALGAAFAEEVGVSNGRGVVAIGRDMRDTSPYLADAFTDALVAAGSDVVDLGLCSTDLVYFYSGTHAMPAVMVTASHNPAAYNGMKLCRAGARPIGQGSGLEGIAAAAARILQSPPAPGRVRGSVRHHDARCDYAVRMTDLVPMPLTRRRRQLRVVVDAGNGMGGHVVPVVFDRLDVELVPMYFELDGSFPNHEANPLDPANLTDLQAAVLEHRADLGLAFDGDADRCFVVDECGKAVTPSAVTALIAEGFLRERPGATILYNAICSRAVREIIDEHGGVPVRTPVGHSRVKAEMARTGALFGGEHSGHYYFADFFLADSGMLAALHVIAALTASATPLSDLMVPYDRYPASGEINRSVADTAPVVRRVAEHFGHREGVSVDWLDGLSVEHERWWFNLRASATEPLLRLNAEGVDDEAMAAVRDAVLALLDDD